MSVLRTCDKCQKSFEVDLNIVREKNLEYKVEEQPNVCYLCLIEQDIEDKIRMAKSFLDTANFLEHTINGVIADSLESAELKRVETKLMRKHVLHFLYAIIIEICIKIIHGIEKNEVAPRIHKIINLYKKLLPQTKREISNRYKLQISQMEKHVLKPFNEKTLTDGRSVNIQLPTLKEALELNEWIVKDFKYDAKLRGKSSALGSLIWDEKLQRQWTVPIPDLVIFPKLLLEYAISLKGAHSTEKSHE